MIPFWQPQMTGREQHYLDRALSANYINEGPLTAEFESILAERIGVRYVICTTSGTAALFLTIKALGAHRVLVPDLTFIATAHAATLAGAQVAVVDVDDRGLLVSDAEADVIIPVHVSGRHARTRYECHVVEDACEAFPKKPEGIAACFSFSPNKVITTGQGGAVATDDEGLARRIRAYKDQGRIKRGTGGDDDHLFLGFNLRFTDLQAAVGLAQMEVLEDRLRRLRRNHALYAQALKVVPSLAGETPLWTDAIVNEPRVLERILQLHGIETRRYWRPLHRQPSYACGGYFPGADRFADHALWLPSGFAMTDDDIGKVVDTMPSEVSV